MVLVVSVTLSANFLSLLAINSSVGCTLSLSSPDSMIPESSSIRRAVAIAGSVAALDAVVGDSVSRSRMLVDLSFSRSRPFL